MKIEATEAEILRNCDELETRSNVRERSQRTTQNYGPNAGGKE